MPGEVIMLTAFQMSICLSFVGGRPMLLLQDHTKGRIKVFVRGVWSFTIIPGHLLHLDCEAVLLGCEDEGVYVEERTTWGGVAFALSEFQQTGEVPCMTHDGFVYE